MDTSRFFEAIAARDVDAVRAALATSPDLARACASPSRAPNGWRRYSAVHAAGEANAPDVLEALLDAGADVHATNDEGRTALHDALEYGHHAVEALLLARGAHQDVCIAAIRGDLDALRARLDEDAARANDRTTGLSPLGWASYGNQPEAARTLLDAGARLDDDELFCAAQCGHVEVARVLVERGADPNGRAGERRLTPLHVAAELRFTCDASAFVDTLLELGADPSLTTADGETPLAVAERLAASAPAADSVPRKRHDEIVRVLRARS